MNSFQVIRPRSSNPADENATPSLNQRGESSMTVGRGRKRKAPSHVSQNACTNCKRARAKCDGVEGQTCTRCNSRGLKDTCQYEPHVKTAKEELVKKIRSLEGTIEDLHSELKKKDAWIDSMTGMFAPGTKGAAILERFKDDPPIYNTLTSALAARPQPTRNLSNSSTALLGSDTDELMDTDEDGSVRWTSVTQDDQKIHHLMALYFAWVHPVHMLFSERHFVNSFKAYDRKYCSSALVNAICALGCRYYVDPEGRDVPINRLGERFSNQAWAELKMEKAMTPVSLVTYAIMFLVQVCAGQARDAFSHLRLAVDSLQDVDRDEWSDEAFEITFFGVHTVNITWAALTYQKPPNLVSHHATVFANVDPDHPASSWKHYKTEKDAAKEGIRSRALETAKASSKLSIINLDTLTAWCGSAGKLTTKTSLKLYRRYLAWRKSLSHALSASADELEQLGDDATLPYTLTLQITYCVALCQLFNPLLDCDNLSKRTKLHIQNIITSSAQEGLRIYERFVSCFSNRYQPPLQCFYLVHLADVILRQDRLNADRVVHFCLKQLGEALPGFPVIGPLQAMFCESVIAWGQRLPNDVEGLMGGRSWQSYSREDKLGCAERLTYAQPVDLLAKVIDESLPDSFKEEWDQFIESHGGLDSEQDDEDDGGSPRRSASALQERRPSDTRAMDINAIVSP